MVKKIAVLLIVAGLCVGAFFLIPGFSDLLIYGKDEKPPTYGESTLTAEEIYIDPNRVDPSYTLPTSSLVTLSNSGITVQGTGATVSESGNVLTILREGTYVISGQMLDGQIVVRAPRGRVHLVLNGMDLRCTWSAPVYIEQAGSVCLTAVEGSENRIADTAGTLFTDAVAEVPDAAIYSAVDLYLSGTGMLKVEGNFREAIHTLDQLVIVDLTLEAHSVADGLVGHDALLLRDAKIRGESGRDFLKSNNTELENLGYIYISGGQYDLTSGCDAIQAERRMLIAEGEFRCQSGGGYTVLRGFESSKCLKSGKELVILGGDFYLDGSDDAVHTDGLLSMSGGSYTLYSGDDAICASTLRILGGSIRASVCMQGLVGERIELEGGRISVSSQNDGILARPNVLTDANDFTLYPENALADATAEFHMRGGYLSIAAEGDALDVRGSLYVSGGLAMLNGPTYQGGDPLDYDGEFVMSGGTVVATGRSSFVPELPKGESVRLLSAVFTGVRTAGVYLSLRGDAGELLFALCPAEDYYTMSVYSCELSIGSAYTLMESGTAVGEEFYGIASDLEGAETVSSFTVMGPLTQLLGRTDIPFPDDYYEDEIL